MECKLKCVNLNQEMMSKYKYQKIFIRNNFNLRIPTWLYMDISSCKICINYLIFTWLLSTVIAFWILCISSLIFAYYFRQLAHKVNSSIKLCFNEESSSVYRNTYNLLIFFYNNKSCAHLEFVVSQKFIVPSISKFFKRLDNYVHTCKTLIANSNSSNKTQIANLKEDYWEQVMMKDWMCL